jgi:hypothetical protein
METTIPNIRPAPASRQRVCTGNANFEQHPFNQAGIHGKLLVEGSRTRKFLHKVMSWFQAEPNPQDDPVGFRSIPQGEVFHGPRSIGAKIDTVLSQLS